MKRDQGRSYKGNDYVLLAPSIPSLGHQCLVKIAILNMKRDKEKTGKDHWETSRHALILKFNIHCEYVLSLFLLFTASKGLSPSLMREKLTVIPLGNFI